MWTRSVAFVVRESGISVILGLAEHFWESKPLKLAGSLCGESFNFVPAYT